MTKRDDARKNAITVPLLADERELIESAAKKLGLNRCGCIRMTMLIEAKKILGK